MSEHERVTLRNEEIALEVVAGEGGRIASLRSVRSGVEFLTQARPGRAAVVPGIDADFATGPCAGAEECLPTVAACLDGEGRRVPDHGDFWQLPWTVEGPDGPGVFDGRDGAAGDPGRSGAATEVLRMQGVGFSRPLRLERELWLEGSTMEMRYRVTNVGAEQTAFLYAWHPLFAVSAGDRVVLPEEVTATRLTHSRTGRFRPGESAVAWPVARTVAGEVDLSIAPALQSGVAEMLYTGRLTTGRCGLYRATERQGVTVSFDTERLPYLGLWLCFSGWPEDGREPRQVAVALEPTVAPYGSLTEAEKAGLASRLAPGASFTWSLRVSVSASDCSFAEFQRLVREEA